MIRRSYLKPGQPPKRKTWLKHGTKPIPQVNVAAKARRVKRNAKRMRSPGYRFARAGAMVRAGGRCEFVEVIRETTGPFARLYGQVTMRCPETMRLQFHEESYARGRILTADDGKMVCPPHHRYLESLKPHKQGKRGFA